MLRQGRVSVPGQVYLVTTIVREREPVFCDWTIACTVCRIAGAAIHDTRFIAWVLMPDHFHGLLLLGEAVTLSRVMHSFKGRAAFEVNKQLGRKGALWQATFHDHAMRREEDLERMARYVVENPVRAGLAATVGEYPFWNAEWEWEC